MSDLEVVVKLHPGRCYFCNTVQPGEDLVGINQFETHPRRCYDREACRQRLIEQMRAADLWVAEQELGKRLIAERAIERQAARKEANNGRRVPESHQAAN